MGVWNGQWRVEVGAPWVAGAGRISAEQLIPITMKRFVLITVLAAGWLGASAAGAADEGSGWKIVAGKWDGRPAPPVWKLAAWPGKDEVVASAGALWSSKDGGETWQRMGDGPGPSKGNAVQIVFDPKNKDTMWTSGMYGWGIWKTANGGKTLTPVGTQTHVDGYAVDFSDPERKVQLFGLHEQEHSLHKSTDAGATWVKIGDKIPQGSEFSTDPIIIDSRTFLINSCGWSKPGEEWGIYRSEDAGESWTKVSKEGASGNPLVTSKGDIFWATQWNYDLIKSADQGKTWTRVKSVARGIVEEVAPGRLVALGGAKKAQLYVSKDDGSTWTAFGDSLPFTARNATYNAARKCFMACAEKGEIARWDGTDPEAAFATASSDVTVWDGEGFAGGNGWMAPPARNSIKPASSEHFNGRQSLEFHVEGAASVSGGWNWASWQSSAMTDASGFESLSFYIKLTGDKPERVQVCLASGPDKAGAISGTADIAKYAPDFMDGQWRQVKVPLKDLCGDSKFDPKNAYEIRFITNPAKESVFNLYVDVVKFLKK